MPSLDATGAASRLLANGALAKAGYCLYYCWRAISQGSVHYLTGGADTAYNTWLAVPAEHQHSSRTVPKDMPAFLGKKLLSAKGDVIISRGDGTFVATDWPKSKQVGVCTLAEREKQTGRKFVGWADSMGGYTLTATTLAGETGTPITTTKEEDEEMAIRGITWTENGVAWAAQYSDTGFWSAISGAADEATKMNASGIPFYDTTASVAHTIENDCAKVRTRTN